jgi:hypothetical protein
MYCQGDGAGPSGRAAWEPPQLAECPDRDPAREGTGMRAAKPSASSTWGGFGSATF